MESLKFVQNGTGVLLRLPTGFRFEPTDEELIFHYLHKKVMSLPLPVNIIPDVQISKSDPWDLPGNSEKERYFFSINEASYPNGDMPNISGGYWKPIGMDRPIAVSNGNEVIVAMKKIFVFYKGRSPNGFETDWFMHQFRIPALVVNPSKKIKLSESSDHAAVAMDNNWVLSKIFRKKEAKIRLFFDLNVDASSSDSNSSGITVESPSTHEPDHQEESSGSKKP